MHFDIIERGRILFLRRFFIFIELLDEIYLWEMDNQTWIKQLITFEQIHCTLIINASNDKSGLLLRKDLKNNKNNHTQVLFISYY